MAIFNSYVSHYQRVIRRIAVPSVPLLLDDWAFSVWGHLMAWSAWNSATGAEICDRWGSHLPTVSSTVFIWKVTGFGKHFKLQYLLQKWGRIATRSGGAGYLVFLRWKWVVHPFFARKRSYPEVVLFQAIPQSFWTFLGNQRVKDSVSAWELAFRYA